MNTDDLFLNVQYGTLIAEIDVTGISRLGKLKSAIKSEFYSTLSQVDAPQLQLYTDSNKDQLINTWALFSSLPQEYFTQDGSCIVIGVSPPPSRQPTQTDLVPTSAAASSALLDFWTAFTNYPNPLEGNTVVQLPADVFILGKDSIGSSIYIRPCYPKLLEKSLSIVQSADIRHLIILGNPGIGKTYFGYFLLLHLARSGATVVYESGVDQKRYLLTPNGVLEGGKDAFWKILDSSSTFYIVDGSAPVDVDAKTILVTSPRREIWHRFSKGSCDIRYMPVWSKEELHFCRPMLFPNVSGELVESLYLKWGGIARYVLKHALVKEQQDFLDKALEVSNIDSVVESFGKSDTAADASSRLIHISVKDDFHSGPYLFASDYVADKIYSRVYEKNRNNLIKFLSAAEEIGETGQLRGILFEKYAHTVIAKGGSFKIRDLRTGSESTLQLPMDLSTLLFSNNSQVQDATNCYFRPISNTFESVDSFIKPNLLFQMTCAKDHPCRQAGLRNVLEILGNPSKPELYFVVPPDRFACFTRQSYLGVDGRVVLETNTIASVRMLTQFVLTFELSSQ
ncbi:hypothetical protein BATDEDRAFT_88508 [Batrachochytrium dendrobatidis JAM81]|uniref:Crinkler effector protein N-terminal domain-containing protein n=1 Tax=Batrachochytrium dendrobatidis (strain JAM81 / FGSC 10211) TaxID=684364 RepID=F4P367_BATDJ|nr:uncharacterized protein BATDEDRAFT_88508 [Batrachochytrium dendrobatidis JAM81]EGF80090.1 hypothetical protein BATDEDRAFT_88508 [Batrachochytrium dendrobatidis JAM81]|eukprot:XP_006679166.1 hypothetical protein BATDEDRAFT_88508 [Batrachochytrium dendrobatidis JAM81]